MKKVRIWLLVILLILQCCLLGCAQSDNGKDDAVGEVSTITTTAQTTLNTTVSNTTSACHTTTTQTTSQKTTEGPPGGSVAHKKFKSVEELFDWIHNSKDAIASLFRGAIQGLKLDRLLIIETANGVFTLEYVRTFQRGSGCDAQIEYYFINEKGERVCLYVNLRDMHAPVDDIKKYVKSNILDNENLKHFKFSYKDISVPMTINSTTTTTAASSGENDKEDAIEIGVGDYSSEG